MIEPEYYYQKDNLSNEYFEGEFRKGYGVLTTIDESNMDFNIQYNYGVFSLQEKTALRSTVSPFSDDFVFMKIHPNYSYRIINSSNNEFSNSMYDITLLDKDGKPHGFSSNINKNGKRTSGEFNHGTLLRYVELPQSYYEHANFVLHEIETECKKALESQKKAQLVKRKYQKNICKDSVSVSFIDNSEYKEICNEKEYYEKLKEKLDNKIALINREKAEKRAQLNQQQLIQARLMESAAAERQAAAIEDASFQRSLQNLNHNSQMQQLNNNLFMMRMGL